MRGCHAFRYAAQPVVVPADHALVVYNGLDAFEIILDLRVCVKSIDQDEIERRAVGYGRDIPGRRSVPVGEECCVCVRPEFFGDICTALSVAFRFVVQCYDGRASGGFKRLGDVDGAETERVSNDEGVLRLELLNIAPECHTLVFAEADRTERAFEAIVRPARMDYAVRPKPVDFSYFHEPVAQLSDQSDRIEIMLLVSVRCVHSIAQSEPG